ncbi:MAG: hypothetical protein K2X93_06775 [Candidatus Obscuribacterales bacterium]|nr:hypothetical protein [Candidatus Obscuribacterales bacterium]
MSETTPKEPWFYIQWKGTHVCGDFHCVCGSHEHACGEEFMYAIRCTLCGRMYEVSDTVKLTEVDPASITHSAIVNLPKTQEEAERLSAIGMVQQLIANGAKVVDVKIGDNKD